MSENVVKEMLSNLPKSWQDLFNDLLVKMKNRGIPEEEVYQSLLNYYKSIPSDVEPNDVERLKYAIRILRVKLSQQLFRPSTPLYILPIGITAPTLSRKRGSFTANIIALSQEKQVGLKPVIVKLYDQAIKFAEEVDPLYLYKITVVRTGNPQIYIATSQSTLEKYKVAANNYETIMKYIEKTLKPKKITLFDARKNVSRTIQRTMPDGSTREFMDPLDMRIYTGVVLRHILREDEKTGFKKGLYIVSDETTPLSDEVDEEGYPVPKVMFCWVHERLLRYDVDSVLYFLGTVRYIVVNPMKNHEESTVETVNESVESTEEMPINVVLTMNAYWVFPTKFVHEIR